MDRGIIIKCLGTTAAALTLVAVLTSAAPPVAGTGEEPALRRAAAYARQGNVDLLVASSARWETAATEDRFWASPFHLGNAVAEKVKYRWPLKHGADSNFRAFVAGYDPTLLKSAEPFREPPLVGKGKRDACRRLGLVAPELSTNRSVADSFIIARGSVRVEKGISWSIVYANGDVVCEDDLNKVIVIADGDIRVKRLVVDSILIARGSVTVAAAFECTVIAGGEAKFEVEKPAPRDPISKNVIEVGEPNPLGIITFFELSRVGLEVGQKDKAVRVAKLTDGSPLRKAGVTVGDTISKVEGSFVNTPEEVRRALRDAIATKGEVTLTLVREGKTIEIRVPVPD